MLQLEPVDEPEAEILAVEVDYIVRQSGVYRDAVKAMTDGELVKCVELLNDMGAIREASFFDEPEKQHRKLAERYVETVAQGKSCLVVSPTHGEGGVVTELIREQLKAGGRLGEDEHKVTRLKDLQWTEAEKADVHNYEVGQVVQFTQHCPGNRKAGIEAAPGGLKTEVVGVDPARNLVTTRDIAGNLRPLPLDKAGRFTVHDQGTIPLAAGDMIRFTRHCRTMPDAKGRTHRLDNGTQARVRGFTEDGHIILDMPSSKRGSEWILRKTAGHFTHGYAITPQAAQGKSVDVCLAAVSAGSLPASTAEQMYVILSRGKEAVELYTDRRTAVIDAMARVQKERSATELLDASAGPRLDARARSQAHAREVVRLREVERVRKEIMQAARNGRAFAGVGRQQTRDDRQRRGRDDRGQHRGRDPGGPGRGR